MSPPKVGRLSFQVVSAHQVITVDLPDFGADGPITSLVTADANLDMVDRLLELTTDQMQRLLSKNLILL